MDNLIKKLEKIKSEIMIDGLPVKYIDEMNEVISDAEKKKELINAFKQPVEVDFEEPLEETRTCEKQIIVSAQYATFNFWPEEQKEKGIPPGDSIEV